MGEWVQLASVGRVVQLFSEVHHAVSLADEGLGDQSLLDEPGAFLGGVEV
jgi:hypothetical protein